MEIIDNLVLPHSRANLELLNYLLILALSIFLIFSGTLFGSSVLSVYFRKKAIKTKSENYIRLFIDYIDLITANRMMGIGLGVIPFISIIMINIQLLHGTGSHIILYLIISFFIYCMALVFLYFFRHTSHLNNIFSLISKKIEDIPESYKTDDLKMISEESVSFNSRAGNYGLFLLFISMWIFIGCMAVSNQPDLWKSTDSIFDITLSFLGLIKFLHFVTAAMSVSTIAFVVKYFFWDEPVHLDEEYSSVAKRINYMIALLFTSIQPVFLVFNMIFTPKMVISELPFGLLLLSLILTFILAHLLYASLKEKKYNRANLSFYLIMIIFALIVFKEQSSFRIALNDQVEKLALNFEKSEQEFAAKHGGAEKVIDGGEIYKAKCTACHKFDVKLVGPPHKDIMIKYGGNKEAMAQYILNPVKVDPNYGMMTSQGLTPKEAKAVVEFMYKEFGNKLK